MKTATYINWEPIKGQSYPDSYYRKTLGIADRSVQKGVYLKELSRKEFLGVEYNNIGAPDDAEKVRRGSRVLRHGDTALSRVLVRVPQPGHRPVRDRPSRRRA